MVGRGRNSCCAQSTCAPAGQACTTAAATLVQRPRQEGSSDVMSSDDDTRPDEQRPQIKGGALPVAVPPSHRSRDGNGSNSDALNRAFGDLVGETLADEILRMLRQVGSNGMSRADLYQMFYPAQSNNKIGAALGRLLIAGKARREGEKTTRGFTREMWFAI
jgi:hypothetical protein